MKHCLSTVLNVPLPNFIFLIYKIKIIKRHDIGRLYRPVKFSALSSIRLLRCYTFIKRLPLPSTLHSCIWRITSLISLNNHFGTLIHAHGCFRFDYPPYHEQSEYLPSIYVIPRLTFKGRILRPPN